MTTVAVTLTHDDGTVEVHEMDLTIKRAFYYTGPIRELPEWFIDKIVPTAQKELEVGEVWTNWNKGNSLTIRGKNGYLIADKGSVIVDHGDNHYSVIKLKKVDWTKDGRKDP